MSTGQTLRETIYICGVNTLITLVYAKAFFHWQGLHENETILKSSVDVIAGTAIAQATHHLIKKSGLEDFFEKRNHVTLNELVHLGITSLIYWRCSYYWNENFSLADFPGIFDRFSIFASLPLVCIIGSIWKDKKRSDLIIPTAFAFTRAQFIMLASEIKKETLSKI